MKIIKAVKSWWGPLKMTKQDLRELEEMEKLFEEHFSASREAQERQSGEAQSDDIPERETDPLIEDSTYSVL